MSTNLLNAGQLAPLIVFKPTGESLYSVIEGETRRRAFNMNATAGKIDADAEIRCWVMPEDTTLERLLVVAAAANTIRSRSEVRRVGKECVRTGRSRRSPYH